MSLAQVAVAPDAPALETARDQQLPDQAASRRAHDSPIEVTPVTSFVTAVRQGLDQVSPLEASLLLTLLVLLQHGATRWYVAGPLSLLCVSGLASRPLRYNRAIWFTIFALAATAPVFESLAADNHKYLTGYWALTILLALHQSTRMDDELAARYLRNAARWLIVLVMGFAVFWKVVTPDYLSGDFFHHELLFDKRFRTAALFLGGATTDLLDQNAKHLAQVLHWSGEWGQAAFETTPKMKPLALVLSWFGVGLEALICLAFALPRNVWLARYRDVPLIGFVVTVYPLATVMGFAGLLLSIGAAQASSPRVLKWYVIVAAVTQLFTMRWGVFLV
jgi:hypothetical protein